MDQKWDGVERRGENIAVELMGQVTQMFENHVREEMTRYDSIRDEIAEHRVASEERHLQLVDRISHMSQSTTSAIEKQNTMVREIHALFKAAFPEGDPNKHRLMHEALDEKAKADAEFWMKTKQNAVSAIVIAVIMWVGTLVWMGLLAGPKG